MLTVVEYGVPIRQKQGVHGQVEMHGLSQTGGLD